MQDSPTALHYATLGLRNVARGSLANDRRETFCRLRRCRNRNIGEACEARIRQRAQPARRTIAKTPIILLTTPFLTLCPPIHMPQRSADNSLQMHEGQNLRSMEF